MIALGLIVFFTHQVKYKLDNPLFLIFFLWFGILSLQLTFGLIRSIFGPLEIRYDQRQIESFKRKLERSGKGIDVSVDVEPVDLYGVGVADLDEAEWRFRASGGYGGEVLDDLSDGSEIDFGYGGKKRWTNQK